MTTLEQAKAIIERNLPKRVAPAKPLEWSRHYQYAETKCQRYTITWDAEKEAPPYQAYRKTKDQPICLGSNIWDREEAKQLCAADAAKVPT